MPALSADFALSDTVAAKLDSTFTFGSTFRTTAPDPKDYAAIPATVVGAAPAQLIGQTGGSDLNFSKGQAVSTVAQAMVDLSVQGRNFGAFVRGALWHDFDLGHDGAAYGNYPNGYTAGAPLSDIGFNPAAKFNGAMVRDAYLSGRFDLGDGYKVEARLGQQVLNWDGEQAISHGNWGGVRMINGGISAAINPNDYVAQLRPGAIPDEAKVAVGMLSMHLASGKQWAADAFVPYETRQAVLPGCGTFFDYVSVAPQGCNLAAAVGAPIPGTPLGTVHSLTENALLGSGFYVHRAGDVMPSARGKFGLAGHYDFEAIQTVVSAYAMNTAASSPFYQMRVETFNDALFAPGAPLAALAATAPFFRLSPASSTAFLSAVHPALAPALNHLFGGTTGLQYDITYPDSVQLYGLSFNTKVSPSMRVFGELAYRPNQPISENLNDVLTAFLLRSPQSLLAEQKGALAVAPGGTYNAFDRFGVGTASLGLSKAFEHVAGADRARVAVEVGVSHVDGLPDPNVMRYGRSFAYGSAPYLNSATKAMTACPQTAVGYNYVPGKTCTTDGFITSTAWGWRLNAGATYSNVLFGASLTPSVMIASDVSGYSFDGTFSAGRLAVRPALRADWGKTYFAQLAYTHMSGGNYNLSADRSNLMLAAGARF